MNRIFSMTGVLLSVACSSASGPVTRSAAAETEHAPSKSQQAATAEALKAPLVPGVSAAGFDFSGGEALYQVDIEKVLGAGKEKPRWGTAAAKAVSPDERGFGYCGAGCHSVMWAGGAIEATFDGNDRLWVFTLRPGYEGKLAFTSADGAHTYAIGVGARVEKDGEPLPLSWGPTPADRGPVPWTELNELYDAYAATYFDQSHTDCVADTTCKATFSPKETLSRIFVTLRKADDPIGTGISFAEDPGPNITPNRIDINVYYTTPKF
jgi:hypothetical protein